MIQFKYTTINSIHQIVYNKKSGLDVSIIDSTVRDAAVLGMNVTFRWK